MLITWIKNILKKMTLASTKDIFKGYCHPKNIV